MATSTSADARADRVFLSGIITLLAFGLIMLLSASNPVGFTRFNDSYYYIKRQLMFGLVPGAILFLAFAKMKYSLWQRAGWLVYSGILLLLLALFVPHLGEVINGSRSWLSVGPLNFQPSEFAKLGIVIITAHLLTQKKHHWDDWQTSLLPILAVIGLPIVFVLLEHDMGTASIMAMIVFVMLFVGGVPTRYLLILSLIGIIGFAGLVIAAPYRAERLTTFLHPELDPKGIGYQINQGFLAIGSGGFWGLGYGNSRQKYQYLPEVEADSIFAIIGEELGFFLCVPFVLLILFVCWRGLRIARGAPDEFGRLVVVGVITWLFWQSALNIGASVGALPLTGVPLPFVSHGGSALMMELAAVGLVANVSKYSKLEI